MEVQIDTGSSELWANPTCSNSWNPSDCILDGLYYPSSSSTKVVSSNTFSITYGICSASGVYIEGNILMGGKSLMLHKWQVVATMLKYYKGGKIITQQFGDALKTTDMVEGILGVGWGYGLDTSYYNIIDQLTAQGITHSRAFSLDLASIDVSDGNNLHLSFVLKFMAEFWLAGSIIFGGIEY